MLGLLGRLGAYPIGCSTISACQVCMGKAPRSIPYKETAAYIHPLPISATAQNGNSPSLGKIQPMGTKPQPASCTMVSLGLSSDFVHSDDVNSDRLLNPSVPLLSQRPTWISDNTLLSWGLYKWTFIKLFHRGSDGKK